MRLPALNQLPATSFLRLHISSKGWSNFLRRNLGQNKIYQIVDDTGVIALYLTPLALCAAMPGHKDPIGHLKRSKKYRLKTLIQTDAARWLRAPDTQHIVAVVTRSRLEHMGLLIPASLLKKPER